MAAQPPGEGRGAPDRSAVRADRPRVAHPLTVCGVNDAAGG